MVLVVVVVMEDRDEGIRIGWCLRWVSIFYCGYDFGKKYLLGKEKEIIICRKVDVIRGGVIKL